jgi:hypothetical protein
MLQIFLALIFTTSLFAYVEAPINPINFEQSPPEIEWKKIVTPHFEIIFPKEILDEAQRVAHLIERAYPFVARSLEVNPPRIPLVLQNRSVDSNGFVTLAPRRSEWYITPSVDPELTNTEWLKTLAIHEFRHVVQFEKIRRGFNKTLEIVLGEVGQAAGLALTLPPWFLEGDAVGIETSLTHGGRGRLPRFERDLRALLLSGKKFNYDKAHLRSYEDFVPNHYVYGYFLTTHLRNKYGDLFLSELANRSAETSWNPLSFYNATDELTTGRFEDFYQDVMSELIKEWQAKLDQLNPTPYEVQNVGNSFGWTNYYYPQMTTNNKIIALKRGLSFINQFVLIDGDTEEIIFYPGVLSQEYPYKVRKNKMAYLELDLDPRWGYQDFSRLKVYDFEARRIVLDVPGTKLRLATLNHEADRILAVNWDTEQTQSIVVLDLKGKELIKVAVPKKQVITSLDWLSDEEAILVIKDFDEQKVLVQISFTDGAMIPVIEESFVNLGFVSVEEGQILVESPASGIDNIYTVQDSALQQITSSRFGAYAPVLKDGKLFYNDYSVEGMNIVQKKLSWDSEESSSDSFFPFYEKFSIFENKESFSEKLAESEIYESSDYSLTKNALNLHSWIILAPPLSNTISLEGYSRDILNKFSLSGGATYNIDERTSQSFVSLAWSHYYPVFDFRASYGTRREDLRVSGNEFEDKWEEGTLEAGIQIPWRKISGRMNQSFTIRAFGKVIKVTNKLSNDETEVNDGALLSPGAEFHYAFLSRMAPRDLVSPLGFSVAGHFEQGKDVTGNDQRGTLTSFDSRYYLPGFWYHHAFYHQLAYEAQEDESYQYSSLISDPRGTDNVFLQEFIKYSGNYSLPLFYPDWNLSRYFYLKRVAMNLFYDELRGRYGSLEYNAASTGWEVLFETYALRLLLPINIGIRGNYVLEGFEKGSNYEIFFNSSMAVF